MIIRLASFALMFLTAIFIPLSVFADSITAADALYEQGGLDNILNAIQKYEAFLNEYPDNFEGNWKCARGYREYGEIAKRNNADKWKRICAQYGKKGMQYAENAKMMRPDHPAGYYYYGLSAGIYSDGTGILTAIKEGLKNKTQNSFEKVYELDKTYEAGGAILALGRFWAVLPWPLYDKKKAIAYYREFQQTDFFQTSIEGRVYLAELLIAKGGRTNKAEAEELLTEAIQFNEPYFNEWALRLLDKIK